MRSFLPVVRRRDDWLSTPAWKMFDKFLDDFHFPKSGQNDFYEPSIDVSETDSHVIVRAEVAGMDKNDLNVTMSDGLLTIRGEKKQEKEEEKENYRFVERRYGSFSRTLRIPDNVEADKIEASYIDGVLKVSIPKNEAEKPRKIEISE
jgi:HSP20 family protein